MSAAARPRHGADPVDVLAEIRRLLSADQGAAPEAPVIADVPSGADSLPPEMIVGLPPYEVAAPPDAAAIAIDDDWPPRLPDESLLDRTTSDEDAADRDWATLGQRPSAVEHVMPRLRRGAAVQPTRPQPDAMAPLDAMLTDLDALDARLAQFRPIPDNPTEDRLAEPRLPPLVLSPVDRISDFIGTVDETSNADDRPLWDMDATLTEIAAVEAHQPVNTQPVGIPPVDVLPPAFVSSPPIAATASSALDVISEGCDRTEKVCVGAETDSEDSLLPQSPDAFAPVDATKDKPEESWLAKNKGHHGGAGDSDRTRPSIREAQPNGVADGLDGADSTCVSNEPTADDVGGAGTIKQCPADQDGHHTAVVAIIDGIMPAAISTTAAPSGVISASTPQSFERSENAMGHEIADLKPAEAARHDQLLSSLPDNEPTSSTAANARYTDQGTVEPSTASAITTPVSGLPPEAARPDDWLATITPHLRGLIRTELQLLLREALIDPSSGQF